MAIINNERKKLLILIVVTTAAIMLPTIYGFLNAKDDTYTGLHILTPGDYPVYYSYIEQVKQGHLAFVDLFTGEPKQQITINPFWLTVGLLAKMYNLPPQTAFHIARLITIPLLIITIYSLLTKVIPEKKQRIGALIFIITAGGFGFWASPLLPQESVPIGVYTAPPDMWTAEANTFLMLLHSPHLMASTIAQILFVLTWTKALETRRMQYTIAGGCILLIWFWFHPFHIVTIAALVTVYILYMFAKKNPDAWYACASATVLAAIAAPAVLYYARLMATDEVTAIKALQNTNLTSAPWLMLIGFGLLIPLAIIGWTQLWKLETRNIARPPKSRYGSGRRREISPARQSLGIGGKYQNSQHLYQMLLLWLPLHWLIIYIPVNFQRRLTQSIHIVTALFAWFGLIWIYKKYIKPYIERKKIHQPSLFILGGILGILLFGFSALGNWLTEFDVIIKRMDHIYLNKSTTEAFTWIKKNTNNQDVILSDIFTSHFIPAFTGRTVFVGHGIETTYYHCCKKHMVSLFFSGKNTPEKTKKFLTNNNITYILLSKSQETQLNKYTFLTKIFDNQSNAIYSFSNNYL